MIPERHLTSARAKQKLSLEPTMDCFKWQCQFGDYLGGALPPLVTRAADPHLESCKNCLNHSRHYRLIIDSIARQPKLKLPEALKKSPLKRDLPKLHLSRNSLAQWERIPWYIRTLLEGISIVLIVMIGVSYAPKLRSLYEGQIEKNLSDFRESPNLTEPLGENLETELPALQAVLSTTGQPGDGDELAGEDEETTDNIHVGKSELWRFSLKTVSPDEIRPQIIKALTEMKIPANTPGLGGVKVPGGIEFDLILPQGHVANIKHALEKLVPKSAEPPNEKAGTGNFSWYRVKSKHQLPEGMSKVVIWLAQPN